MAEVKLPAAPQRQDFETELGYWKAMYEHRENEAHLLSEEIVRLKRILSNRFGYSEEPKPLSPEQKAIQLFLSKEHPTDLPCGCVGRRRKGYSGAASEQLEDEYQELIVHNLGENKLKSIQQLRRDFDIPIYFAKSILDRGTFRTRCTYIKDRTVAELRKLGCKVEVLQHGQSDYEPACPCEMRWIVQVDNHYYRIRENRSPEGVTHTAEHLGHVAGPYRIS